MMNPWVPLIVLLTIMATGIGGYLFGRSDGRKLESAEHQSVAAAIELTAKTTREQVADQIAKIEVNNVYTTQRLEKETVEKPVYRDCVHSNDAFSLLNDALTDPDDRPNSGAVVVPETGSAD